MLNYTVSSHQSGNISSIVTPINLSLLPDDDTLMEVDGAGVPSKSPSKSQSWNTIVTSILVDEDSIPDVSPEDIIRASGDSQSLSIEHMQKQPAGGRYSPLDNKTKLGTHDISIEQKNLDMEAETLIQLKESPMSTDNTSRSIEIYSHSSGKFTDIQPDVDRRKGNIPRSAESEGHIPPSDSPVIQADTPLITYHNPYLPDDQQGYAWIVNLAVAVGFFTGAAVFPHSQF